MDTLVAYASSDDDEQPNVVLPSSSKRKRSPSQVGDAELSLPHGKKRFVQLSSFTPLLYMVLFGVSDLLVFEGNCPRSHRYSQPLFRTLTHRNIKGVCERSHMLRVSLHHMSMSLCLWGVMLQEKGLEDL